MRLKLTKDFTNQLKGLGVTFAIGAVTGSFNFGQNASVILRTLADEIDKQNPPKP